MVKMYDALSCSSYSTLQAEPDDISLFLQQILLRSSSGSYSSSSSLMTATNVLFENQQSPVQPVSGLDRMVSLVESPSGLMSSSGGVYTSSAVHFPVTSANVSSSSVGTVDNETDEYDCESEERLVEEPPVVKPAPPSSSSKRSRAAEVHNLSEKRRRSRINEKMKALQNLIPNSNKMDKASMLDEAIQYLKQLQLQVQMLTMRNGLSLHNLRLPGVLHHYQLPQMEMGYCEGNVSLNMMNMAGLIPVHHDISQSMPLRFPDNCTIPKQTSVANCSSIDNLVASFGWESPHDGSFQLPGSSRENHREKALSCQQINEDHPTSSSIAYRIEGVATENILHACPPGKEQFECVRFADLEREAVMLPQMDGHWKKCAYQN